MKNLHKYYYKDYFSLQDVPVNNVYRHLDYELLLDDTKKHLLESQIKTLEGQKKNAQGRQREQIEAQITEIKAQITVNANVLKVRNNVLTGTDFVKKDSRNEPTRDLLDDAKINLDNAITSSKGYQEIDLDIQYPGLVTGVGIDHETKVEGEFKLGVHFDWTHGMPVVYGSSVKGVLRAWVLDAYYNSKNKYHKCGIDGDDLLMEIFEGAYNRDVEAEKKKYGEKWAEKVKKVENRIYTSRRSIYDRDIFFDAVLEKADKKGRILCSDSITPHLQGPLKNPIPITFLKIAPGCTLEFRFKLVNSKIGDFKKEEKLKIFQEILTTVGIGAKTNVGYGQLKAV